MAEPRPQFARQSLQVLAAYNDYANALVLEAAGHLTPGELARESSPSHSSIFNLLIHTLAVEAGFLSYCLGYRVIPHRPETLDLQALRQPWQQVVEARRAYLDSSNEQEMQRRVAVEMRGEELVYPVWQLLLQSFTHSTHHRGELSILFGQAGHPLPTLDIIIPFTQESGQRWPYQDGG